MGSEESSATIVETLKQIRRPVVLTIAGFDPSAGAGVSADLKVFAAHGLYGMACITALTVQSTMGVRAIEPVAASTLAATLQMLAEDVSFAGIKIGMLATAENCEAVADFLETLPRIPVVLDPVLRSTSGRELLDPPGVTMLRERLLPVVNWITPNREELFVLIQAKSGSIHEIPAAAMELQTRAVGNERLNVLVTGGDLDPPEDYLLSESGQAHWISGQRVNTTSTHGTGCALSSALLCRLVQREAPMTAATGAKAYLEAALRAAYPVGRGRGPINHLFASEE